MPDQPNITNIPSSRVEVIDPRTGMISREWYRFFLNLFNLAGSGGNQTSLDDLQIGPPPQPSTGSSGTVTSVALALPTIMSVSGSPVTTSGTLIGALVTQSVNTLFAGPSSGAAADPTFRALATADIPALAYVTSVALALPSIMAVSGSPVTSSGTLTGALTTQAVNTIFAGPSSGAAAAPTFRALTTADIPALGITNDTTTATNLFPLFSTATSGALTSVNTGNANLLYKPSTGELTASAHVSSNGIQINANTVATSYTIATGNNGLSAGPVSVNTGITVTISTGSTWTVV